MIRFCMRIFTLKADLYTCTQVPLSQRQGTGFCNGVGHVPVETGGVAIHKISITHSNLNDQIIKPSQSSITRIIKLLDRQY